MVGFSEGSPVANLKNWARSPTQTRKERSTVNQSRRTSQHDPNPTTTDTDETPAQDRQSQAQHVATAVEVEQSQRASLVAPMIAVAAETEQTERTSFVTQQSVDYCTPD